MKKLILPVMLAISFLFFLPQNLSAQQTDLDCRKVYDQEDYKCLGVFNECNKSCVDSAYAGQSLEVDGGKLYKECIKSNDCHGKSDTCHKQASANYSTCLKSGKQPQVAEAKKEVATGKGFVDINFLEPLAEFISDPSLIVKETEILIEKSEIPEGPRITPPHILHKIAEDVNIWLDQQKQAKDLWIKPKGQNEYQPFNPSQTVEPGSYVKVSEPTDFWVRGVGKVQLRPGPSGNALVAIEEINGATSPFLLLGEMEVAYSKPIVESTQKPVDWEQIKFVVRTPNSSVTVSRTHYLVRYDEKENRTTVTVYEGQVEVKPVGGKTISITPDGDPSVGSGQGKPGVVIVAQKLSVWKLALAGLTLVAVIGGAVVILKRKFLQKRIGKKTKS